MPPQGPRSSGGPADDSLLSAFRIARTTLGTTGSPGSITLVSNDTATFSIADAAVDWDDLWIGLAVEKMGATSGWTKGQIVDCPDGVDDGGQWAYCQDESPLPFSSSCFDYYYPPNGTYLECQFEALLYSDGGDSGGAVFGATHQAVFDHPYPVKLLGVLFGGPVLGFDGEGNAIPNTAWTWFSPWRGVLLDHGDGVPADISICGPGGNWECT